jgi:Pyruvate/2-oxoacid:ferredoxin oxidoreductase gamma subunit
MERVGTVKHYSSKNDFNSYRGKKIEKSSIKSKKVDDITDSVKKGKVPLPASASEERASISNSAKKIVKSGTKSVATNMLASGLKAAGTILSSSISAMDDKVINKNRSTLVIDNKESPAVIFISGFKLGGISGDSESGVAKMSKAINGAKHFSWDQEDLILKEINKHSYGTPIILVGHSFGGDSAVEIANSLNSLEYGFRKVDLLVTLDSVGIDNDIIPVNVKKNMNFISDMDLIFNDGPNIARDFNTTTVINELRSDDHTSLDDSSEVQSKIFSEVQTVLFPARARTIVPTFGENLQVHNLSRH